MEVGHKLVDPASAGVGEWLRSKELVGSVKLQNT